MLRHAQKYKSGRRKDGDGRVGLPVIFSAVHGGLDEEQKSHLKEKLRLLQSRTDTSGRKRKTKTFLADSFNRGQLLENLDLDERFDGLDEEQKSCLKNKLGLWLANTNTQEEWEWRREAYLEAYLVAWWEKENIEREEWRRKREGWTKKRGMETVRYY